MNIDSTVPPEFAKDLGYLRSQDVSGLMACLVGLGGEVFMLKAEVERLRRALEAAGGVSPQSLETIGNSPAFADWLQKEQAEFGRAIIAPFIQTTTGNSQA